MCHHHGPDPAPTSYSSSWKSWAGSWGSYFLIPCNSLTWTAPHTHTCCHHPGHHSLHPTTRDHRRDHPHHRAGLGLPHTVTAHTHTTGPLKGSSLRERPWLR